MSTLHNFFFNVYPYICLTVFLMGSLARFDRDQYTWKSDSSQLLRARQLRWGSNLFHVGILFLFGGHTVGLLTPHFVYEPFLSPGTKQLIAVYAGVWPVSSVSSACPCCCTVAFLTHASASPATAPTSSFWSFCGFNWFWA